MKIRFDGKDYDMSTPADAAAFQAAVSAFETKRASELSTATARADAAEARATKAEGDAKKLREDAADTARLDAAVEARVSLEGTAARVIGAAFKPVGTDGKRMTDRQIREAVIRHDSATAKLDGKDDTYVTAYFDAVVTRLDASGTIDEAPAAISRARDKPKSERDDSADPDPEAARRRMLADNAKAYETSFKAN